MVAAICYAWLLENRIRTKKEGVEGGDGEAAAAVVPVMNMRRGKMWKQRQVAWLFHHVGLDATALLFSDEVLALLDLHMYLSYICALKVTLLDFAKERDSCLEAKCS